MCNCSHQPCQTCQQPCFDAPLTPQWPAAPPPESTCDTLADLVDQLKAQTRGCGLAVVVNKVEASADGFRIMVAVTGNKGPVEVSLNRRTYYPGLMVSGARGSAVVVYVREVRGHRCEGAVYVSLTDGCISPVKPVVAIVDSTCEQPGGSINLANKPANATAYWYTSTNGTGTGSTTPPVYNNAAAVSGSVRYCLTGQAACCSEATAFLTKPVGCLCTAVSFVSNEMVAATVGKPYTRRIALTGTVPFAITSKLLPAWMSASIDKTELVLTGTPLPSDVTQTASVSVGLSNCNGDKSAKFLSTLSVLSVNAGVDSDWEVIGRKCRGCNETPSLRIAAIRCNDGSTTTNPCTSTTPQLRVAGIRCSPTTGGGGTTTNPCDGVGSSFKVAGIRCNADTTTPGTTTNPCAGVSSALKITGIKCSQ